MMDVSVCGTCNGSGVVMTYTEGPYGREDELAQPDADTCPACGGLRFPPKTVELIAKAIYNKDRFSLTGLNPTWDQEVEPVKDEYRQVAVAALDALNKETP